VWHYAEHILDTQVSYDEFLISEIVKRVPLWHSTIPLLNKTRYQHIYSGHLEESKHNVLHTHCVIPIHNQFWELPLSNVCWLWQPVGLHHLLLGLVKDLLNWLLK